MKIKIFTLSLFLMFLAGCKKEEDITPSPVTTNPPTPTGSFAANEARISPAAKIYLIADVEGLTGITHINHQDTDRYVSAGWGAGSCPTGNTYSGGLQYADCNTTIATISDFEATYLGTGETREKLLAQQYTTFITPAKESHGIELTYKAPDGNTYYSNLCNNPALSWANIALVERQPINGGSNASMMPDFYVRLKFNCELANKANHSQTIRLKNVVLRVKM